MTKAERKIDLMDWLRGEYHEGYSGRGMFGKTCDAWEYESEHDAIIDMMTALTETDEVWPEDAVTLLKIFKTYRIDSMGKGIILYFPQYKGAIV